MRVRQCLPRSGPAAGAIAAALSVGGCGDRLAFEDAHVNQPPTLEVVKTDAVEGTADASVTITAAQGHAVRLAGR